MRYVLTLAHLQAVDAEEGDGKNLPAYMRAGMKKGDADDELAALGDDLEVILL